MLQRRSFETRLRRGSSKGGFEGWVSKCVSEEVFECDFEGKVPREASYGMLRREAFGLRRSWKSGIQRAASKEQTRLKYGITAVVCKPIDSERAVLELHTQRHVQQQQHF